MRGVARKKKRVKRWRMDRDREIGICIWRIHSTVCGGHKLVSIYAEIDRGQNPGTSPAILFSYSCKKHPRIAYVARSLHVPALH